MTRKHPPSKSSGLWGFLASVKLSIILLLTLAGASIIGTLIPQNQDATAYVQAFGEVGFRILKALHLFDLYHSGWFRFLMVMLTVNIIVCSIHRLKTTWKIIFPARRHFNVRQISTSGHAVTFFAASTIEVVLRAARPLVTGGFRYAREEESEGEHRLLTESGRWGRMGVYVVHLSVICLLFGGLMGSIFGFDGFVTIPEGETVHQIRLSNSPEPKVLDFGIQCRDFEVRFYEGEKWAGRPSEYRSSLAIVKKGEVLAEKEIVVNRPLRHAGINIFQSSYGRLPPRRLTLEVAVKKDGRRHQLPAVLGETVDLPENLGRMVVRDFRENTMLAGHNIGPAFLATFQPPEGPGASVTMPFPFPEMDVDDKHLAMLQTPLADTATAVNLTFISQASGMQYAETMSIGDRFDIPENLGTFALQEFVPEYDFMGHAMGPTYLGQLTTAGGKPVEVALPVRFAKFDHMRRGQVSIVAEPSKGVVDTGLVFRVPEFEERYYTGLQVTRDPGVGIVYAGFLLMIVGCYVTFFVTHQKVCVILEPEAGRLRVTVAGQSTRNPVGMRRRIERIRRAIENTSGIQKEGSSEDLSSP